MGLKLINGDIHPYPMEGNFLPFNSSLCVTLAEVIQAHIVLSVAFVSQLFFCQQIWASASIVPKAHSRLS